MTEHTEQSPKPILTKEGRGRIVAWATGVAVAIIFIVFLVPRAPELLEKYHELVPRAETTAAVPLQLEYPNCKDADGQDARGIKLEPTPDDNDSGEINTIIDLKSYCWGGEITTPDDWRSWYIHPTANQEYDVRFRNGLRIHITPANEGSHLGQLRGIFRIRGNGKVLVTVRRE